jgi:hypothetical protein
VASGEYNLETRGRDRRAARDRRAGMTGRNVLRETAVRRAMAVTTGAILLSYSLTIDIHSVSLECIVGALLAICLLSALLANSSSAVGSLAQKIQVSLCSLCLLFLCLETLRFVPGIIPRQIRDYLITGDLSRSRVEIVEYLDRSPYVKFRPMVTVRSQGSRGTRGQFVYEWRTDRRGFKNTDAVAALGRVDVVALGDSFTEGMGVAVADTWPSVMSARGMATYNLGVQGYAPVQLEGAFREYGLSLRPAWVVIGYTARTYEREEAFLDERAAIRERRFTGGIASLVGLSEVRRASRQVTTALYLFSVDSMIRLVRSGMFVPRPADIVDPALARYASEIRADAVAPPASGLDASVSFGRTLRAFAGIKKLADDIGARVVLLYMPQRGEVYYERATGKAAPSQRFHAQESGLLRQWAERNGLGFLDSTGALRDYVKNLAGPLAMDRYPYLEIDGHLSPVGHRIVADLVYGFISQQTTVLEMSWKPEHP